ncbi:MAG: class I SAM-dependent methyltransferase [Rhizomicrobium sp.]
MNINWYLVPPRFKRIRRHFGKRPIKLMDVGTAGNSLAIAKRWLPNCQYYGVDITDAHLTADEKGRMAAFYLVNLDTDDLAAIPNRYFDAIVVAHVAEHLKDGLGALGRLSAKLAPGGRMYVEFPSVRSLNLPEARHTLNFSDDSTHIHVPDVREVANALMDQGLRIVRAGPRREWSRILLSFVSAPLQLAVYLKEGRLHGMGLWDLYGFADFVYARRPEDA